jgi:hypothetical protein
MQLGVSDRVKAGCRISYDDGRAGHQGVRTAVLEVTEGTGMLVQFDDGADTTYILFSEPRWMDFVLILS